MLAGAQEPLVPYVESRGNYLPPRVRSVGSITSLETPDEALDRPIEVTCRPAHRPGPCRQDEKLQGTPPVSSIVVEQSWTSDVPDDDHSTRCQSTVVPIACHHVDWSNYAAFAGLTRLTTNGGIVSFRRQNYFQRMVDTFQLRYTTPPDTHVLWEQVRRLNSPVVERLCPYVVWYWGACWDASQGVFGNKIHEWVLQEHWERSTLVCFYSDGVRTKHTTCLCDLGLEWMNTTPEIERTISKRTITCMKALHERVFNGSIKPEKKHDSTQTKHTLGVQTLENLHSNALARPARLLWEGAFGKEMREMGIDPMPGEIDIVHCRHIEPEGTWIGTEPCCEEHRNYGIDKPRLRGGMNDELRALHEERLRRTRVNSEVPPSPDHEGEVEAPVVQPDAIDIGATSPVVQSDTVDGAPQYAQTVMERLVDGPASTISDSDLVIVGSARYRCSVGCSDARRTGNRGHVLTCGHAIHTACAIRMGQVANGEVTILCPLCRRRQTLAVQANPIPVAATPSYERRGTVNCVRRAARPYVPGFPAPDFVQENLVGFQCLRLFRTQVNRPCGLAALNGLAHLFPPEISLPMRRRIEDYAAAHVQIDGNQIEVGDIVAMVRDLELPFGVHLLVDGVDGHVINYELLRGAVPGLGIYLLCPRPVPVRRAHDGVLAFDTHYVPAYLPLGRQGRLERDPSSYSRGQIAFLEEHQRVAQGFVAAFHGTNRSPPEWARYLPYLNDASSGVRSTRPVAAPDVPAREGTGAVLRVQPTLPPPPAVVAVAPPATSGSTGEPAPSMPVTVVHTGPSDVDTASSVPEPEVEAASSESSDEPSPSHALVEGLPDPDPLFDRVRPFEECTAYRMNERWTVPPVLRPIQALCEDDDYFDLAPGSTPGPAFIETRPEELAALGLPARMVWVSPRPPPLLTRSATSPELVRWHWATTPGNLMDRPDLSHRDVTQCKCMYHGRNYCRHVLQAIACGKYVICCGYKPTALMLHHPRLYVAGVAAMQERLTTHYAAHHGRLDWGAGEGENFDALPHPYLVTLGCPSNFWAVRREGLLMILVRKKRQGEIRQLVTTCIEEGGILQLIHGAVVGVVMQSIGRIWDAVNWALTSLLHVNIYELVAIAIKIILTPILGHNPIGIACCVFVAVLAVVFIVKNAIAKYYWRLSLTTRVTAMLTGGLLFCAIELLRTWAHPDPGHVAARPMPTDVVQGCLHPDAAASPFTLDVATRLNHTVTENEASGIIRSTCCRNNVIVRTAYADRAVAAAGTLQDHFAAVRQAPRLSGSACNPKRRGCCKSCGVELRGMKKLKYMLCRNCLKCLPETRGTFSDPPIEDFDISCIRAGSPHTGEVPLMPIWSCPLPPPPGTETETYPGNDYRTTYNYARAETQSCSPVQIRGVGVGVLHPRHFPHVQPRGPNSLALGLDCRMFSKKTQACGASWAAVETLDDLLMERVIHRKKTIGPQQFNEWLQNQERKTDMLQAKLQIELTGYEPCEARAGVFGKAQWNKGWENTGEMFEPITHFKPRIIVSPDDRHHVTLGPWIAPVQAMLKEAWPVEGPIAYMGSATPAMMDAYATRLHLYDLLGYAFVLGDMSQFETTKSMASNAHTHKIMKDYWSDDLHDGKRDQCLRWQLNPTFRATCGGEVFTGQTTCCLPSGVPNTTLSNNLDSGFTHAAACICGLLQIHPSVIPLQPRELIEEAYRACHVGVAGDDSVTAVPRMFRGVPVNLEAFMECYANAIKALGFKPKLELVSDIRKIVFLGCRLYICEKDGVVRRKWGPTLGRRLYKHHFCLDLIGNPFDWLATVADMEVRCYSHVPILSDIAERVTAITGKPRPLRRVMQQRMKVAEQYAAPIERDHNWHYNEQTLDDLCVVYGVGRQDLADLMDKIKAITTVPYVLSHPVLERFFATDDH